MLDKVPFILSVLVLITPFLIANSNYEMNTKQLSILTISLFFMNVFLIGFIVFIYLKLRNKQGPKGERGPPGPTGATTIQSTTTSK
jgi:heme/copper-type cytochrome/quinol oxidase subunit 4